MSVPTPKDREPRLQASPILRFSGMAGTMATIILFCVWAGRKWDAQSGTSTPWGTLLGAIIGTLAAMVAMIQMAWKKNG